MSIILNGSTGITTPAETATTSVTTPIVTSPSATALTIQSAGTTAMTVSTSQYVGVGTTSPQSTLSIKGAFQGSPTGGDGIQLGAIGGYAVMEMSGTTGGFIDFNKGDGTDFLGRIIYNNTSNYMSFQTNSVEAARIDTSGNLLVGTTVSGSPTTTGVALKANNFNEFRRDAAYVMGIFITNANTGPFVEFRQNGSIRGTISTDGSTTAYNTSSDYRLKENVTQISDGLSAVSLLNPVRYHWKENGTPGEGFLAHELQEVIPLAVTGAKDAVDDEGNIKPQGVDYSKIVVHLVAAIQELSAKNDALEARLAALEAK